MGRGGHPCGCGVWWALLVVLVGCAPGLVLSAGAEASAVRNGSIECAALRTGEQQGSVAEHTFV